MKKKDETKSIHKPLYNIKKAEELSGISANLIRAYERMGLLKPYRDPDNNYRLFTKDEIEWIKQIKYLINEVGLNIEGIKCVLTIDSCWKDRKCTDEEREKCPAYNKYNFPCWQAKVDISCCDEVNNCYKCSYYINSRRQPKLNRKK